MGKKKMVVVNGREWTVDDVRKLIEEREDAALRALMVIYSYQTEHEKSAQRCSDYNGVGFTKFDVKTLTSIAQWYKSRGYISKKQYELLSWKMPKYAKQIWKHMERTTAKV